jgi:hypothetical protein
MGARARAVHRGADGSVHYLSSTPDGSLLIITDPAVGVTRIPFDGPCRLIPRSPLLPAGYDAVDYRSIGASGSTLVSVRPGERPFTYGVTGLCDSCMDGPHDFGLWPVCPGEGERQVFGPAPVPASEPVSVSRGVPDEPVGREELQRRFYERKRESEPVPVSVAEPASVGAASEPAPVADSAEESDVDEFLELDGDEEPVKKPDSEVLRNARLLAQRVWSGGGQPRHVLEPRGAVAAAFDEPLNEAIAQRWIRIQGDRIVPGVRSPFPKGESGGWGPGDGGDLYRTRAG